MFPVLYTRFDDCVDSGCAVSPPGSASSPDSLAINQKELQQYYYNSTIEDDTFFNPPRYTFPNHKCDTYLRYLQHMRHPLAPDMFLPNSTYRNRFIQHSGPVPSGEKEKPWMPRWRRTRRQTKAQLEIDPQMGNVVEEDEGNVADVQESVSDAIAVLEATNQVDPLSLNATDSPAPVATPQLLSRPSSNRPQTAVITISRASVLIMDHESAETMVITAQISAKPTKQTLLAPKKQHPPPTTGKLPVLKSNPSEEPNSNEKPIISFPARLYQNRSKGYKKFGRYNAHGGSSVNEESDAMDGDAIILDEVASSNQGEVDLPSSASNKGSQMGHEVYDDDSGLENNSNYYKHANVITSGFGGSNHSSNDYNDYVRNFEDLVHANGGLGIFGKGNYSKIKKSDKIKQQQEHAVVERNSTSPQISLQKQQPSKNDAAVKLMTNRSAPFSFNLLPRDYRRFQKALANNRSKQAKLLSYSAMTKKVEGEADNQPVSNSEAFSNTDLMPSAATFDGGVPNTESSLDTGLGSTDASNSIDGKPNEVAISNLPAISDRDEYSPRGGKSTTLTQSNDEILPREELTEAEREHRIMVERRRQKEARLTLPRFFGGMSSCCPGHAFNDARITTSFVERQKHPRGFHFSSITEQLLDYYRNMDERRIFVETERSFCT